MSPDPKPPAGLRADVLNAPAYHFSAKSAPIKLDQNESPYDLPEALKAAVFKRLSETAFNRYPDLDALSVKRRLAAYHDWPDGGVVVTGGSNILIQAFVMAAGLGQQVLSVAPTFSVYPMQANLQGAKRIDVPLKANFRLPVAELLEKLKTGRGVFFLANPAAPTGNTFDEADIRQLCEAARDKWLVVLDEAYYQFSSTDLSPLARDYSHVAVIRTFSKAFGLGGVRLGYGLMQPSLAVQIQKVVMPFSVSALQIATAEVVLEAADFVSGRVQEAVAERGKLFSHLSNLPGVTPFESQANFILFRVVDAEGFYERLLAQGVLVRRQDHLPGLGGCLRVSVGKPQENDRFLEAAKIVSEQLSSEVGYG